eukprot:scaffold5130_cov28-Tisochrysis_lutea.AAC.1
MEPVFPPGPPQAAPPAVNPSILPPLSRQLEARYGYGRYGPPSAIRAYQVEVDVAVRVKIESIEEKLNQKDSSQLAARRAKRSTGLSKTWQPTAHFVVRGASTTRTPKQKQIHPPPKKRKRGGAKLVPTGTRFSPSARRSLSPLPKNR